MGNRKSTKNYWDNNWKLANDGIKPSNKVSYFWTEIDNKFKDIFANLDTKYLSLIEIGAGASEWLPKLNKDYNFNVFGLDYSEEGCKRCSDILKSHGIKGDVFQGDMFESFPDLESKFDVVVSFGLVEHFEDTAQAIAACSKFAKTGGLIVTMIPNMKGLNGFFYKLLNRKVYDTHTPLSLIDLVNAHQKANLIVYYKSHILSLPSLIDGHRKEKLLMRKILRKIAFSITKIIWFLDGTFLNIPRNKYTSPYMICAARKN